EPGPVEPSPARAGRDRQRVTEDVVLNQMRGLLMPLDAVGQRQQDVMRGGRGDSELSVRVLADLQPFVRRNPGEALEAGERADPVWREAIAVGLACADACVRVCLRPQPLVRADADRGSAAQLRKVADRMITAGLLDEVD